MGKMQNIRTLIGKAKIKDALIEALKLESEFQNTILGLQSRLSNLESKELQNSIHFSNANVERNSIINSLLEVVEKIENETSNLEPEIDVTDDESFEKIIGRNGLKRIEWLSKGVEKAKSVCKIHTADGYVGTGFLVDDGFIFTNNHVLGSPSVAQYSKVEFGYESSDTPSVFYELDHTKFITSVFYDYTRVKVNDIPSKTKLSHWGKLHLVDIPPKKNDALIIIQHPQGRQKEIAFSDGGNSIWEHRLHYKVTTEPGSSGSPVFDINWNVIALHHAGGNLSINQKGEKRYVNEGIMFNYILEDLSKNRTDENPIKSQKPEKNLTKPIKSLLVYNLKDSEYADGLFSHLYSQIRNGNLSVFDIQNDIPPDADKEDFLNKKFEESTIIFALISKNLYKRDTLKIALNVEDQIPAKRVIPIRISPFDLNGTPFEKLQGLPLGGSSISDFNDIDSTLFEIVSSINKVIKNILNLEVE